MTETTRIQMMKAIPGSLRAKSRTLDAIISTNQVDRDGEVIEPAAFKGRIDTFMANPVLLWMHNPLSPPIGKVESLDFKPDRVEASLKFADEGTTELADDIWGLFKQGILRTFSIGFRIFEMIQEHDADGDPKPPRVTDAELFEVSAVSVPANPNAVAKLYRQSELLGGQPLTSSTKMLACSHVELLQRAKLVLDRVDQKGLEGRYVSDEELAAVRDLRLSAVIANYGNKEVRALQDLSDHLDRTVSEMRWGRAVG